MKVQVLIAGAAALAMCAGAGVASAAVGGRYAEPSQPIAYSKLNAYLHASPHRRAHGDWGLQTAQTGTPANASATTMGQTGATNNGAATTPGQSDQNGANMPNANGSTTQNYTNPPAENGATQTPNSQETAPGQSPMATPNTGDNGAGAPAGQSAPDQQPQGSAPTAPNEGGTAGGGSMGGGTSGGGTSGGTGAP